MSRSPLIEIRHLVRNVANLSQPLLDVAHFSVAPGERIGLRGPTGSGKSSLLRAIAGLDPWQNGELLFRSEPIAADAMPAYRRQVVYLPQRPALIAGTVEDNLRLPFQLAIARGGYRHETVRQLLAHLDESDAFLQRPSDGLSGGERQLVSLVRAVQLQPHVLDEPTASLDVDSARRFEAAVSHWHHGSDPAAAPRAYVIASHDAGQIERMSDRVVTINNGLIPESTSHE